MNALRTWAVVYGLIFMLASASATQVDNSTANLAQLDTATSVSFVLTAAVTGAQFIAVIVMMIRGSYLRRKERTRTQGARAARRT
tara:strand:- start:1748 stop:2002 length:255 start_codon:yes stop_codon:yes gene_type:complete